MMPTLVKGYVFSTWRVFVSASFCCVFFHPFHADAASAVGAGGDG